MSEEDLGNGNTNKGYQGRKRGMGKKRRPRRGRERKETFLVVVATETVLYVPHSMLRVLPALSYLSL